MVYDGRKEYEKCEFQEISCSVVDMKFGSAVFWKVHIGLYFYVQQFLFPRKYIKIFDNTSYKVVKGSREQPQRLN